MRISLTKTFLLHVTMIMVTGLILFYGYSTTIWNDIGLYKNDANNFLHSSQTNNKLPKEYPILSLIPMLIPTTLGDAGYATAFNFICLVVIFSLYLFLFYGSSKTAAFTFLIYIIVGSLGVVLSRLDIILSTLIFFSLYQANKQKFPSAYILLAIGTMFKFIPALLVIPLFIQEQQLFHYKLTPKKFYNISMFLITCSLLFSLSLLIDTNASFSPFNFAINRPIQIESIPASIIHTISLLGIIHTCSYVDFGSGNIYLKQANVCNPPQSDLWKLITQEVTISLVLCLAFGIIYIANELRNKRMNLSHAYIATLLLFLSTNKVFSAQYIIWLLPLIAYTHKFEKKMFSLTFLIALSTTIIFPILPHGNTVISIPEVNLEDGILVRNIIFVFTTITYIFNLWNIRQSEPRKL